MEKTGNTPWRGGCRGDKVINMTTDKTVAHQLEQAEKLRVLKEKITEGMTDVAAGRLHEWNLVEFLRQARTHD